MNESLDRARRGAGLLPGAALALGLVWTTAPGVPLYDGVGFPDEPYRFVREPPGHRVTKPPTVAAGHVTIRGGRSAAVTAASAESGPQVQFYLAPGALTVAAAGLDVRADPEAPSAAPPALRIDGNAYRVRVVARPGAPAVFHPGDRSWISMRATKPTVDPPTFLYRPAPGKAWQRRETVRIGNDIYVTRLAGLGDYSLAFDTRPAVRAQGKDGGGRSRLVLGLGAVLVLLGGVLVWARLAASRR